MIRIDISQDIIFYLSLIGVVSFRYIKLSKRKEKINRCKELILFLFCIYIVKVVSLVFFPISFQFGVNIIRIKPIVFLNPINSWKYIISSNDLYEIVYNILGNLMLLFPLPVFIIYKYKKKVENIVIIFFICLLVSTGIEIGQYIESSLIAGVGRFFETNDIILNTLGGVLGYIVYDKYIKKILNYN